MGRALYADEWHTRRALAALGVHAHPPVLLRVYGLSQPVVISTTWRKLFTTRPRSTAHATQGTHPPATPRGDRQSGHTSRRCEVGTAVCGAGVAVFILNRTKRN